MRDLRVFAPKTAEGAERIAQDRRVAVLTPEHVSLDTAKSNVAY